MPRYQTSQDQPQPVRQKTILVVDDEVDLVATLKELLESEGYRVVTASNGEEALQKLNHIHPDLIMLDMNMPKMSGLQFYKRITTFDQNGHSMCPYPILILTARAELQQLFHDLQVDGFINKPFQLGELLGKIEDIFARNPTKAEKNNFVITKKAIKVLLVESDDNTFKTGITEFAAAGHLVTGARTSKEALERIVDQKPDIVFVRYKLPEITGDVLAMQLKKRLSSKDIPIVLYDEASVLAEDRMDQIEHEIGLKGLISSCDPKDLVEYIKKVVQVV